MMISLFIQNSGLTHFLLWVPRFCFPGECVYVSFNSLSEFRILFRPPQFYLAVFLWVYNSLDIDSDCHIYV